MRIDKRYVNYVRKYIPIMVLMLGLSLLLTISSLVKTYFLSLIIDDVLLQGNMALLKIIIILLGLMVVLDLLLSFVLGYFNTYITQKITIMLRKNIISTIFKAKLSWVNQCKVGDFISRITDDVEILAGFLCNMPLTLLGSVITIVITVVWLFYLSPLMAILAVVMVIIQIISTFYLSKFSRKNQQDIREKKAQHIGLIKQMFDGFKQIRAYRGEYSNKKKYFIFNREMLKLNFVAYFISNIYGSASMLITFLGSIIIFVVGVIMVSKGIISIGILFVFDSIIDILYRSISNIVSLFLQANKTIVSYKRLDEIINIEFEDEGSLSLKDEVGAIKFKDVNFRYKDKHIYQSLNISFLPKQTYAIVGRSGIGKSTLINLILKFYLPDEGLIEVNGIDSNLVSTKQLRERVAVVFQDDCIIDGTIYDNIRFGEDNYKALSEEKIHEIAELCNIDEFAKKLPHGYDTVLEEGGTNLSGGQKQRINLARTLVRDFDVCIFDEAFSQMDRSLEHKLMNSIKEKYKDKILIFITHNIDAIQEVSNILIFNEDGIDMGTSEELYASCEDYRQLCTKES